MEVVKQLGLAATRASTAAGRASWIEAKLRREPQQGAAMLPTVGGQALADMQAATAALTQLRTTGQQLADSDRPALGRAFGALSNAANALQQSTTTIASLAAKAGAAAQQTAQQLTAGAQALQQASQRAQQQHPFATAPIQAVIPSPTTQPSTAAAPFAGATGPASHLLILSGASETFYFNLATAAHDAFKRQTAYQIASQARLSRRPALQAVGQGADSLTLTGAIFTAADFGRGRAGIDQLNRLRRIGFALAPVTLTTGYGEVLGRWYLVKIDEEQAYLLSNGAPRKQTYTLEFQRYGEDYADR